MPGRLNFEFELGNARTRRPRDDDAPMRLLVLGDFSGRPLADRPPLASRPTYKVDVDTRDAVMQRIAPTLQLPAGQIAFRSIDDFHPDALFARVDVFAALRHARTASSSQGVATGDDLGRLLGKPAGPAAAPAAPSSGIEALIRKVVEPHIVKDSSSGKGSHQAAIDAATALEMRSLLHTPAFQALESAWRGAHWLISTLELDGPLELHIFDTTREEVIDDVVAVQGRLAETGLYRAVIDRSGEERWSVLASLFDITPSATDMGLLAAIGAIGANAGAPLLAGTGSSWPLDSDPPLAEWNALRRSDVARWIGLAAPRVLLRRPYGKGSDPIESFAFEELAGVPAANELLWGNGALALLLLLGRGFNERGWDVEPGDEREIGDLPAYTFTRDGERELQPGAEQTISERQIDRMITAGLIPIASHRHRNAVTVVRVQSIADPPAALAW